MKLLATLLLGIGVLFSADLAGVHTIYVDEFGGGPDSGLIREQIVSRLFNSKYFEVTENEKAADAKLTGLVQTSTAVVRLVLPDGTILWMKEAKVSATAGTVVKGIFGRRTTANGASSQLADKLVKDLEKSVRRALKRQKVRKRK